MSDLIVLYTHANYICARHSENSEEMKYTYKDVVAILNEQTF